jgi:peptidoglycan glycosyltransferase
VNRELKRVSMIVIGMFVALFVSASLIQVIQVDTLAADGRNTRTLYDSYNEKRGAILVAGSPIAESVPVDDAYKYQRVYTKPEMYANITGYFTLNQGLTGIEAAMNAELSGKANSQFLSQLNALLTGQPVQGASVDLTIDPLMQQAAFDGLAKYSGAVSVIEPATGKILALASTPSYNPNQMAAHNSTSVINYYKSLLASPGKPLIDRAITGDMNPPGSVFKLVIMAAALESGKYGPDSTFPNPATFQLPLTDVSIQNANRAACPPGGATVSLADALRYSCNIPFAELGLALGRKAILEQAKKFGFNESFTIPMKTGVSTVPTVMDDPQTALASFGQYDVRATPLQMSMVSAGIANGGKVMYPNMVNAVIEPNLKTSSQFEAKEFSQAMSPANAAILTKMMVADVDDSYLITNVRISGVKVAGKTGTAENGPGAPFTLWFTGFAPAENPKYAITVVVENGGGLGQAGFTNDIAVPIARKVLEAELKK